MATSSYRPHSLRSDSSSSSARSYASDHSRSTAPTVYSERPVLKHYDTSPAYYSVYEQDDPRASVETYASTTPSTTDLEIQPQHDLPPERINTHSSDSIPTIPPEFAELFEPNRRIQIHHDDSTSDGNMNLRLDTEINVHGGHKRKMTLFHLRMRDLPDRIFSLRRYCRESGREVCHSKRKFTAPLPVKKAQRPRLQRSLSTAISSLIGAKSSKSSSRSRRNSMQDPSEESGAPHFVDRAPEPKSTNPSTNATVPTNTIRMEFSNYAQVEVHVCGTKSSKRYEFEYWGSSYYWARQVQQNGDIRAISYHLINAAASRLIAHISPEHMTRRQVWEEEYKGGWIPPCSLCITDENAFSTDLADVIVATGLIALADDCIKRRWHNKSGVGINSPLAKAADTFAPQQIRDEKRRRQGRTTL